MDTEKKVELLAPAGDLEKLKVAVLYGADAVYIGGEKFGLRAKAKNFTIEQMREGVEFAHSHDVKVYVTCNIFAHNSDFATMAEYFKSLEEVGVDAIIVADAGVFLFAKETVPNMEIHISTQANSTNYNIVKFWKNQGAKRVVLARELSFNEIKKINEEVDGVDIETFVHGAMCIAYSGRCLLSNYFSSRDSNKGACSQACRWKYYIVEESRPNEYYPIEEDDGGSYILNSKDLCMIQQIPELINAGIYSMKVEGRIKTSYYVATVIKAYREAIDDYIKDPNLYESKKEYYFEEVKKASNRGYTTGFYNSKAGEDSQVYTTSSYVRTYDFIGLVLDYDNETKIATIEQRNKFVVGDEIEFLTIKGSSFGQKIVELYDNKMNAITEAPHPQQIIKLKVDKPVTPYDMMRKESDNPSELI